MTAAGAARSGIGILASAALAACVETAGAPAGGPPAGAVAGSGAAGSGAAAYGGGSGGAPAGAGALIAALGVASAVGLSAGDDDGDRRQVAQAATTVAVAALIVSRLNEVWKECRAIGQAEYHIDCLSEGYVRASSAIPQDATFAASRQAILSAASRLRSVAEANRAAALPPLSGGNRQRPIRAVDPARLAQAEAQATRIIEETQTVLLRASEQSLDRKVAYQQIAQALDSSKALLRS